MRITVLVENTAACPGLITEHGLSMHIGWKGGNLMMDFGHKGAVTENAKALGVDLTGADMGVLSHGHFDHGGGIAAFREVNPAMPIYVQKEAFDQYWASRVDGSVEYIGLDAALLRDENIRSVSGVTELGAGALLADGITGRKLYSRANDSLLMKTERGLEPDLFRHEQLLFLPNGSGYVLFSGCAHNGIVNVMERAAAVWGKAPGAVFGGFHLADPTSSRGYDPELTDAIGRELLKYPTRYFTCHCTGVAAYGVLQKTMGDAVAYAACGDVIEL